MTKDAAQGDVTSKQELEKRLLNELDEDSVADDAAETKDKPAPGIPHIHDADDS